MKTTFLLTTIISILLISCSQKQNVNIVVGNAQLSDTGNDLVTYLSKTYPDKTFQVTDKKLSGEDNIELQIADEFENSETYKISGDKNLLMIKGKTPRAIVNGVYGLLRDLGWNFYLSFEIPPTEPKPLDFSRIYIENKPLTGRRIIFNWHNFMSGCTGWDYEQWKEWIDNSTKIGFNTIMVHAYGNNPMQSFSLNGREKELGYLTTTRKGRDWGAEHVNDVRLMTGGWLYSDFEFGSKAAKVKDDDRSKAATVLMQKVFQYAAKKSMDVCFAIDLDTWMANPQNIINTLPADALLKIDRYNTANPEHPEGRKYFVAQLKKLLEDYPEITMLAAWMRMPQKNPGQGSIWLKYDSNTLPAKWRKEYFEILKQNPELTDERPYPGIFAISKIVRVYREILDEIRPDVELVLGSWRLDYPKQADPFMPKYCGFIPLDWQVIFNNPKVLSELSEVGKNRKLYPVVWAQHDDHRYIGRPYKPFNDFNSKLNQVNASGYGVIHWTTHPLDLYFNNTENQVWQNTENESLQTSVEQFAKSLMTSEEPNLIAYYNSWFENAPMFGRETSDYFINPGAEFMHDGYNSAEEVVERSKERIKILNEVDKNALNEFGIKEFNYQLGMENFIISFFRNHGNIHQAYKLLAENKPETALPLVKKLNPEETIKIYAKTISDFGATRGEEGILLSLNLRWLPDYVDIRQRVKKEPIRINLQPTFHDPLAQGPGKYTFFIDNEKNLWVAKGEKELGLNAATNGKLPLAEVTDSWVEIDKQAEFSLTTMRNFNLTAGKYKLELIFAKGSAGCEIEVLQNEKNISTQSNDEVLLETNGEELILQIIPEYEKVLVAGIVIGPI